MITADEVSFAGGLYGSNNSSAYYYLNKSGGSATGSTWWWTMSPYSWNGISANAIVFNVPGSSNPGTLDGYSVSRARGVRPVVSLKSCTKTTGGTGDDPYTVSIAYNGTV